MARRNRETLKKYFNKGKRPTEEHFADLIDSCENLVDDVYEQTRKVGLKVAPKVNSDEMIEFIKRMDDDEVVWSCRMQKKKLNISGISGSSTTFADISEDRNVPEMVTNNLIVSRGRIGNYAFGEVPADGQWHDIMTNLDGCHAYEIMAGATNKQKKYVMAHVIATTAFNKRNKIRYTQAMYRGWFRRIKVKFRRCGEHYNFSLAIKTQTNYGVGCTIKYNIACLWENHFME
ncbi:hypothetical protein K4L44_00245 [Halosquirtibacter laminarini]|uniref:Uncharacterized protein n=1 Tax=Halosquirtibacter laminarini TaxID=3374600 RepID=A0AC61NFH2_9BACT|nr:hypothetical protein K4L44_00245 [Prolixibacteraceae bacterium]